MKRTSPAHPTPHPAWRNGVRRSLPFGWLATNKLFFFVVSTTQLALSHRDAGRNLVFHPTKFPSLPTHGMIANTVPQPSRQLFVPPPNAVVP